MEHYLEAKHHLILPLGWPLQCQLLLSTFVLSGHGFSSISLVGFENRVRVFLMPLIGQLSLILLKIPNLLFSLHTGLPWKRSSVNVGSKKAIQKLLNTKYAELGPMSFQQVAVLVHFSILVALWFFREPRYV